MGSVGSSPGVGYLFVPTPRLLFLPCKLVLAADNKRAWTEPLYYRIKFSLHYLHLVFTFISHLVLPLCIHYPHSSGSKLIVIQWTHRPTVLLQRLTEGHLWS